MSRGSLAAVTAVGNDRPGIVAAVTRALYESGCNLEDATSTILSGHFSMVLVVSLPQGVMLEGIEERLTSVAQTLDLVVTVRPVHEAQRAVTAPSHVISVYGGDKPGIVYRVAAHLSSDGVNITDLSSRVIGSEEHPVYALMLEVAAPSGVTGEALSAGLEDLKNELSVDITVNEIEPDLF